jgi:exosortase H (IPTLxxWG-CTERM-specific)
MRGRVTTPEPSRADRVGKRLLTFWIGFVLLTVGFWLALTQQAVLRPVCNLTAVLLATTLDLIGQDVGVVGNVINSNRGGVAFEIIGECTASLPMSFMAAFMLSFPVSWRSKLVGLACTLPALLAWNILRLSSLWFLAQWDSPQFETIHMVVWPCLMVLFPVVLLLFWARRVLHGEQHATWFA